MTCFVTHLESAIDGTRLPAGQIQTMHGDRPLWVRYDLEGVRNAVDRQQLVARPPTMWRYRELLPPVHDESIVSFGEGMSPTIAAQGSANSLVCTIYG